MRSRFLRRNTVVDSVVSTKFKIEIPPVFFASYEYSPSIISRTHVHRKYAVGSY